MLRSCVNRPIFYIAVLFLCPKSYWWAEAQWKFTFPYLRQKYISSKITNFRKCFSADFPRWCWFTGSYFCEIFAAQYFEGSFAIIGRCYLLPPWPVNSVLHTGHYVAMVGISHSVRLRKSYGDIDRTNQRSLQSTMLIDLLRRFDIQLGLLTYFWCVAYDRRSAWKWNPHEYYQPDY